MSFKQRWLIVTTVAVVLAVVYFLVDPNGSWWVPKCPFRMITGWQCPGCGGQRMAHALLQGNVREAISYNYYMVLAGPYVLAFLVDWLMPDGNARARFRQLLEKKWLVWTYIVTFCVWLVVRNILHI